jgi:anti-anti-sigma factor
MDFQSDSASPGASTSSMAEVEVSGYLNRAQHDDFFAKLVVADASRPLALVLNCSHLLYFDSAIIGVLVEFHRRLEEDGRRLVLRWVPDNVLRVLECASLQTLFHIDVDRRRRPASGEIYRPPNPVLGNLKRCWELYQCGAEQCENYNRQVYACWLSPHVPCKSVISATLNHEIASCAKCEVFKNNINEFGSIQENFANYIRQAEAAYLEITGERPSLAEEREAHGVPHAALFEDATDVVLIIDSSSGVLLSANPQAKRLLRIEEAAIGVAKATDFCPSLRHPPYPWEKSPLTTDSHHRRWDQEWVSSKGDIFTFEVTYSPLRGPSTGGILIIARDVTQERGREARRSMDQQRLLAAVEGLKTAGESSRLYEGNWDPKTLCQIVLQDSLAAFPQADAGFVLLHDEVEGTLGVQAARGYSQPDLLGWIHLAPGETLPGFDPQVFWGGRPEGGQKRRSLEAEELWRGALGSLEVCSQQVFQIPGNGRNIGVLVLQSLRAQNAFQTPGKLQINLLLEAAGTALERALAPTEKGGEDRVLGSLLNALPFPAFAFGGNGLLVHFNAEAGCKLGWDAQAVHRKAFGEVFLDPGQHVWNGILAVIQKGGRWKGNLSLREGPSQRLPLGVQASPVDLPQTPFKGVLFIAGLGESVQEN